MSDTSPQFCTVPHEGFCAGSILPEGICQYGAEKRRKALGRSVDAMFGSKSKLEPEQMTIPVIKVSVNWPMGHCEVKYADVIQIGTARYGVLSFEETWTPEDAITTLEMVEEQYWPIVFPQLCSEANQN